MRIALAQINPTVGDLEGNAAPDRRARGRGRGGPGPQLVVFPELVISGYPPEDLLLKDHFLADCAQKLTEVARACSQIVARRRCSLAGGGARLQRAAVLAGGRSPGWYRKICLPNYAVFDEKRYFTPGARVLVLARRRCAARRSTSARTSGTRRPRAYSPRARAGHGWSSTCPCRRTTSARGASGKRCSRGGPSSAGTYVCYVNGVGGQDELVFDGQSVVLDPDGRAAGARARSSRRSCWWSTSTSPGRAARSRVGGGLQAARRRVAAGSLRASTAAHRVQGDRSPPECVLGRTAGRRIPRDPPRSARPGSRTVCPRRPRSTQALCLGVRDYVHKNGFAHVVMGMSGGIDSALTACMAADALGSDKVTAVSMPSRYSSVGTQERRPGDAPSAWASTSTRSPSRRSSRPTWGASRPIFAERQPGRHRAEHPGPHPRQPADGSVEQVRLAGADHRQQERDGGRLRHAVRRHGRRFRGAQGRAQDAGLPAGRPTATRWDPALGPFPASTIERAPSAELRRDQTDQDTLPPYEVLDRIIEAYVVRGRERRRDRRPGYRPTARWSGWWA